MKKIFTAIFSCAVLFSGCAALDENPTTSLAEPAIFATQGGVESLMTGCYQGLKLTDMWGGRLVEYLQEGSLLVHWKGERTQSGFQQCLDLTMYSQDQYNYNCLTSTYAAINRCNNVIDNLFLCPLSDTYKKQIEAEAKLIRSVIYFYAVRMWGDVPLILTSPKDLDDANAPRTSYLKVYKQILDDLTFAEENMRTREEQRTINGDTGRPNKWAATAYKACVYLQMASILWGGDENQPFKEPADFSECGVPDLKTAWEKALEYADKVIDSGVYELAPKYSDLFRWTDPEDFQLKERIFVLNNSNMANGATAYPQYTLPQFPEGSSNTSAKAGNWGRVRPERWVFQKWCKDYNGTLDTSERDDMLSGQLYIDCDDPRMKASYWYGKYKRLDTGKNVNIYPSDKCVAGVDGAHNAETFAPYFRKYVSPAYDGNNGEADLYLLRFAEMYLIAAEASAELSTSVGDKYWTDALDYIEKLHERARNTKIGATQPIWEEGRFSTKEELTTGIFWERVYEMGGELHEWFDMRRRGAQWVIDHITTPFNAFLQEPAQGRSLTDAKEGYSYWEATYFSRVFPTTTGPILNGLLCAFPEQEILNNSAIGPEDQNKYIVR